MRNKIIPAIAMSLFLYACKKDVTESKLPIPAALADIQSSSSPDTVYGSDWSGIVQTVRVTGRSAIYDTSNIVDVDVPDDYVLVGGGTVAVYLWMQYTGYITAAIPDANLRTWHTASQSHNVPYAHQLNSYAIGLKIQGVSREELISHLQVLSDTASGSSLYAAIQIDTSRYQLIGGGGKVSSDNNGLLLSGMFPYEIYWSVSPRAFRAYSNGQSVATAIGISKELLALKGLETDEEFGQSWIDLTTILGEIPIDSSWAVTGAGAYSQYLSGIMPTTHGMHAAGNDPLNSVDPFMYTYMLRMRKKLPVH